MKQQPNWLDQTLYPFTSRWLSVDGDDIHYIDEGSGPVLLFVHGTPEWSFGYRDLVKTLRHDFRCVALDLLGFGLSDKPARGDYSVAAHAHRLEKFVHALDLKNLTLVANDFGAGIGMGYVLSEPDNIRQIVLSNTWMWSLKEDEHYSGPARMINSWLGKLLYQRFNFPVRAVMPAAFGDKKKLTSAIHAHYKNALPDPASRVGAYAFAKELMSASDWWQANWEKMSRIEDKPFLIFWGMKDKFVLAAELDKWKSKLPKAKVVTFKDAGHFVQEEKPNEMIASMKAFLAG